MNGIVVSRRNFLAVALLAILPVGQAQAMKVPVLAEVPDTFGDPRYSALKSEHSDLSKRLKSIRTRAADFNLICKRSARGSSNAAQCRSMVKSLRSEVSAYGVGEKAFNRTIAQERAAQCPKGNYEISRLLIQRRVRLACDCRLGFVPVEGKCVRKFPVDILKGLAPMLLQEKTGEVRASIPGVVSPPVMKPGFGLGANSIFTGADSYLVLDLLVGRELTIGMNSNLKISLRDGLLSLDSLKGRIRFRTEGKASLSDSASPDSKKARLTAMRYFRIDSAVIQKYGGMAKKRFRIRTPGGMAVARGTEFAIHGKANGDFVYAVFAGEIELTGKDGKRKLQLRGGDSALVTAAGKFQKLPRQETAILKSDWHSLSGVPVKK